MLNRKNAKKTWLSVQFLQKLGYEAVEFRRKKEENCGINKMEKGKFEKESINKKRFEGVG